MNTTIDFKTAKTIENMSRKIDGMERAVSGFFNKMSDIAERKYGDPQVYLAAVGPARDLSAILLEEAPGILPCFDETDDTFGISKELPVAGGFQNEMEGFTMSEKLDKLRASLEKEKERRIKINNRIESLERRIQEAEAAKVNEMVRTAKVTPEQLAALLRQSANTTPNPAALAAVGATFDKEDDSDEV